jgi:hypothetical protein
MQFIKGGPDIPDALLEAHEEGEVVFFCGAGISYPAGLPGFKGLVDEVYKLVGDLPNGIEQEAYDRKQFDAVLDLLERRVPGQRFALRQHVFNALKPNLRKKGATDTHKALLQLARTRQGNLRLVTTNFDRIFQSIAKRTKMSLPSYSAPLLPIPKKSRWDGIVYLHGILPENLDETVLNQLVMTSGDFGLAYLIERWASRFVGELFRNYVVCFVGYSIDDPVLRYMMDALAADRMLGEITPQAYALGAFEEGAERQKINEWKAKGVQPILYEVPAGSKDHSALHRTLDDWAATYRDGVLGKEQIVVNHAFTHPSASSVQDDFVGRVLWALSDESGLPAKRFADFNPAPPLSWIPVLTENRFGVADLPRFGLMPIKENPDSLKFSLLHRPAPYTRSPWSSLMTEVSGESNWDKIMYHMARWLVRYLNSPTLFVALAERGGLPHSELVRLMYYELTRIKLLENEGNAGELEAIRLNSPDAIPTKLMRSLWMIFLAGQIKSSSHRLNILDWLDRLDIDGLTPSLRFSFRQILAPKLKISKPYRYSGQSDVPDELYKVANCELELAGDHVASGLRTPRHENFEAILVDLFPDIQFLLMEALDLLREVGEANDFRDRTFFHLPSISPHFQNRGYHDWVLLIELLRDSWIAIWSLNPGTAAALASQWFDIRYPIFKRLALFAATYDGVVKPHQWVELLISENAFCLWASETRREVMRVLVLKGAELNPRLRRKLEKTILLGSTRFSEILDGEVEDERRVVHKNREIWVRLAKLREGGALLGKDALKCLEGIEFSNPNWQLSKHDREEFSQWMSGSEDPDHQENMRIDNVPTELHSLVSWLKKNPPVDRYNRNDNWQELCHSELDLCVLALDNLRNENIWQAGRWRESLQVWSDEALAQRSWVACSEILQHMPDEVLNEISSSATWWLRRVSDTCSLYESELFNLCQRILNLESHDGVDTDEPVSRAINHPVGQVAELLLEMWLKRKPNDGDMLPADLRPVFTALCDTSVERWRHARVIFSSRIISFFRVDPGWTESYLLPLFDWKRSEVEARAAWEGFFWSPRLHKPLLLALKKPFLEVSRHYPELVENRRHYSTFLARAALESVEGFTSDEFRLAILELPQEGLESVAQSVTQILESAGEQKAEYWSNRVAPFWQEKWPKSIELVTNSISTSLARLSIAADECFPAALDAVKAWLQPISDPGYVVFLLFESSLVRDFPSDALTLLDLIVGNQQWAPQKLPACLEQAVIAEPKLIKDLRYKRLMHYWRVHNQ